jgi:glucokinase
MVAHGKQRYWVGFDLGGTKMLAAVFDRDFKLVGSQRRKTKTSEGLRGSVSRIVATLDQALEQAGVRRSQVAGIGFGVPAFVDLERGVVLKAPNLGWNNVPLRKRLSRQLGAPVVVANDVDAGTYGEYRFGAGRKARCVVGVFPGTGIGGGCVYNGAILSGRRVSCMEIGHVPVQADGPLCGCGQRGCLEAVASRLAIAAEAAKAAYRGQAPHLLKLAGTDIAKIRSGVLRASIEAGDKMVERIVRHAAGQIGQALVGVVNLLAPDVVVLGGGLAEEMPDLFCEEARQAIQKGVIPALRDVARISPARLGDNACVLGAAALAAAAAEGH